MDVVLKHFSAEEGGFYFTADDHEQLIQRPRPWMDDALPSGNGIAAQVLLRMGNLLGNATYLEAAEKTLRTAWADMRQVPHAHNALLSALEEYLYPTEIIMVRGKSKELAKWQRKLKQRYAPSRYIVYISDEIRDLHVDLATYTAPKNGVRAYCCRNGVCQEPVTSLQQLVIN